MRNLNRVVLVGRVGQDPEIRHLDNNVAVCKFSLATNDRYQDKQGNWVDSPTEWHDIVLWRNLAERANTELKKGKLVYIEGKIGYRKWEDKEGNPRKSTDIVARFFRAFEAPQSSGNNFPTMDNDPKRSAAPPTNNANNDAKPVANANNNVKPAAPAADKSFEETPEDDLPF